MKRYQLLSQLGTGGMGAVFLGRDDDGNPVAVKRQHAHLADDPQAVARFFDEARLAARIKHPNVVGVIDVTMNDGELVLVMEYIEGTSVAGLQRVLRSREQRGFHWTEALRLVADSLRGLHAAHELRDRQGQLLGVIHRDVSPQNLLVGVDGATRVTDFGIARAAGRLKLTHTNSGVAGKLLYLSPEQIKRDPVDHRADVFAAGVVLWECLVGTSPFDGETEAETIARVVRGAIDPPSAHEHEIPLEVDEICLRALERDPERRFSTAAEFADALEAAGPATHAQIARVVMRCVGDDVLGRQALLTAPPSGAETLDPAAARRSSAGLPPGGGPPSGGASRGASAPIDVRVERLSSSDGLSAPISSPSSPGWSSMSGAAPVPPSPSRRRIAPGTVIGLAVGVLAGGLAVATFARPTGPAGSPDPSSVPSTSAGMAPASTVIEVADPPPSSETSAAVRTAPSPASSAVPSDSSAAAAPPSAVRPLPYRAPRAKPRTVNGVNEYVPKEM